ncbi:MAG: DUF2459 domain-containing protein [Pseudomonadota bacterium]|nr:DUF2459 domain-containing protein [Pseudomonadota bacterium]
MTRVLIALLGLLLASPTPAADNTSATVLVVRHRWHTGIAFPADRLSPALAFLAPHFNEPAFYEIGWGDDAFYRQDDSLWLRLRAMLWPTQSVLHVVGLQQHPADLPHTDLEPLCLDSEQLRRLQQGLAASFVINEEGQLSAGDPGLYGDSRFFPARGTFWFGHTCNSWTARRLGEAGVPMRRFLTVTAGQVLTQLRHTSLAGACRSNQ